MTAIRIRHMTTYRFREAVHLSPHRLMLRPRESRELRLMSHILTITPDAVTKWAQDVFGNTVALINFADTAPTLVIGSEADILLDAVDWPVFDIAASAISYPFRYSDEEWTDLGALTIAQYPDPGGRLQNWTRGFIRSNPTDTLSLLKDLNAGVAQHVRYQSREIEGTQSPQESLDRGWVVPRLCSLVRRIRAKARLRRAARLRLPPRPEPSAPRFGRCWLDPCLGRGVPTRRGLGHLRPDESQRRWSKSDPRRSCPRYQPVHASIRKLLWPKR